MGYDDFLRYLEAKQSVDDRALNRAVWEAMKRFVCSFANGPRILEVGAGHGAMLDRLAGQGLLEGATYTAVDPDERSMTAARRRFESDARIGELRFQTASLYDLVSADTREWDLVVAHAVLDLLDLDRALPVLQSRCVPGGRFYFTINFDGGTVFEPTIDPAFDAEIVARYHQTMDERIVDGEPSGHSQTGRRLLRELIARGAIVEEAGSSDWVVWPRRGAYQGDEAYFLHFIVATVGRALAGSADLDAARLGRWVAARHAQIEHGTLVYVAHQLDFFGRWPKVPTPHPRAPS
jgi:SAM-dependent methyltransferase